MPVFFNSSPFALIISDIVFFLFYSRFNKAILSCDSSRVDRNTDLLKINTNLSHAVDLYVHSSLHCFYVYSAPVATLIDFTCSYCTLCSYQSL